MSKQNEKEKDFVKDITKMEDDFAQWYTDVIKKTDLVDYSPVKGFMVIKPYGYALWEGIQAFLDRVIMVHSDNRGLVLPPRLAPIQVVIVPIAQKKEGVLEHANALYEELKALGIKVKLDDTTENSTGWKFNEYEMKGVPIRIEVGPRDIENSVIMAARRDTLEKSSVERIGAGETIKRLLDTIHDDMLERARVSRDEKTFAFVSSQVK